MAQTQPTDSEWLDDILDDFGHKAVNGAERHGTNIETRKAILDGLQARGWKSPDVAIQAIIDELESLREEAKHESVHTIQEMITARIHLLSQLRRSAQETADTKEGE